MFEKLIKFKAPKEYIDSLDKDLYPKPIKLNIPDWYKRLKHTGEDQTIKGCIPFLDTLITGYVLSIPQESYFHWGYDKQNNKEYQGHRFAFHDSFTGEVNLNNSQTKEKEAHGPQQIQGSDLNNKSKFPVCKFLNPWTIETPPGYSCLLVSPLNNSDKRFSIITGIVDTDTYETPINFPFIINKKIIEDNKITIKQGTPYVQVIPFKRDNWKMKVEQESINKGFSFNLNFSTTLYQRYKNKIWKKKNYK
tara:strand:- start:960 stop:1706 length:747 start_codon:yes stop_codon:yes gene_type:complete